jgi:cell division protein FtsW (lipid II flippase)
MKLYQIYFSVLNFLVLGRIVISAADLDIAKHPFFDFLDVVFKVSLGLFLAVYFVFFPPKGFDPKDAFIISLGGLLLLAEIRFAPLVKLYETREVVLRKLFSLKNGQDTS